MAPILGSVGNFVWWDVNGNGIQDTGEPGIPGVTVTLYDASGNNLVTTDANGNAVVPATTDDNGAYLFANLVPGRYTVKFTTPAGFLPTQVNAPGGTPASDSNGLTALSAVLTSGQSDLTLDSGFVKPTSYTVTKTAVTASPVAMGTTVHFQIKIVNTGQTWITTLPLVDTYDINYLQYLNAVPASFDNINDGSIKWTNLAPGGLAPFDPMSTADEVVIDVYFLAIVDTTGQQGPPINHTVNGAIVPQIGTMVDADGPGNNIPPANSPITDQKDSEPMEIINPTGVTLVGASATLGADGVTIAWETADEAGILGFNVLAGASADSLAAVNVELIMAVSAGTSGGNAYSYVASPGAAVYVLEVLGLDGSVERIVLGQ